MPTQDISLSMMAALVVTAVAGQAKPSEYPDVGRLHGEIDHDLLFYECEEPRQGEMTCEFDQIFVRRHKVPEDFEENLSERLPELANELENEEFYEFCNKMNSVGDLQKLLESSQPFESASQIEKEDMRQRIEILYSICEDPTEKSIEEMAKFENDMKSRTCKISLFEYKQVFKRVSNDLFVQESSPKGPCGIVGVSRFIKDNNLFWKYVGEDKVTNPDGEALLGSCAEIPQGPHPYTWNTNPMYTGCDYIEIGY